MKIKTRRYYIYYLMRMGFFIISLLPLKVSLKIAEFFGQIAYRFGDKYRDVAMQNLQQVFSEDREKNAKIVEEVFKNFTKNGAEWVKLYSLNKKDVLKTLVTETEGFENLDKVMDTGRGALVLCFHFGNWELVGIGLRSLGYPGSLIARRLYFHKYDDIITGMRARFEANVIYRDESPKKMLRELRNGKILGVVPDQDIDSINGVFVDYFGKPAFTPIAPVKLAMAAKTQIVPIFAIRKKDNTHKLLVEEPIDVSQSDGSEEDVLKFTQEWTNVLEKYVRKYPEQWVWVHKRWKTQPDKQ